MNSFFSPKKSPSRNSTPTDCKKKAPPDISLKEYLRRHMETQKTKTAKIEAGIRKYKNLGTINSITRLVEDMGKFLTTIENVSNIQENIANSSSSSTQTDIVEDKVSTIEIEAVMKINTQLIKEISILTEEVNNLKRDSQNKDQDKIKHLNIELIEIKQENEEIKIKLRALEKEIKKKSDYIKNLEDSIRLSNEEKYNIDEDEDILENESESANLFTKLISKHKLAEITKFLNPTDIFNLKHSDRALYLSIDTDPIIIKQILYNTVESLKVNKSTVLECEIEAETEMNRNLDDEDLITHNINIERLFSKYHPSKDKANNINADYRKEFGTTILKAIDYLNNDINYFMKTNINGMRNGKNFAINNNHHKENNASNLLNSFGGYMNKFVNQIFNPNENNISQSSNNNHLSSNNTTTSNTPNSKINSEHRNNKNFSSLELEFLTFDKKEHNFNFSSSTELKNLIYSCFFKVGEMNNMNYFKSFVEEISNFYANLLFYSIEVLKELYEMKIVKNSLFEFVAELKDEKRELVKEYNEIVRTNNSLAYINQHVEADRNALREKVNEMVDEIRRRVKIEAELAKENKIVQEKLKHLEDDYYDFKFAYKKENVNLKSDLTLVVKERDRLMEDFLNIQEMVMNIQK